MNKLLLLGGFVFAFVFASCVHDPVVDPLDKKIKNHLNYLSKTGSYDYYIFPESDDYASLPNQDPVNPLNAKKAELGKMIFHETGFAQNPSQEECRETYSCSSCHISSAGFTPGRMQGIADGALGHGENRQYWDLYDTDEVDAQGLRPLTILNVGYMTNTLWSGIFGAHGVNEGTEDLWDNSFLSEVNHFGFEGLESQNIEGLQLHRLEVTKKVLDEYGYRQWFDECFPELPPEERYSDKAASFALGAYLRSVLANEAPFQKYLKGDKYAISEQEKRGAILFLDKAGCSNCHNGPSFSSMEFHVLGTQDLYHHDEAVNTSDNDLRNRGRGFFTEDEADYYKFKVPQLYNVSDYTHFFHGSSKQTLREVLEFKMLAKSENSNVTNDRLSGKFKPVDLTEEEVEDLLSFLGKSLRDPNLDRYVPESVLSGNCFPNNDRISRFEQGCE